MPKVANTRKAFNFVVEMLGFNQFEIQKVTIPKITIEKSLHGDTNHDIKTPGRVKVEDIIFEKLRPLPQVDSVAWNWLTSAQSMDTGGGNLALGYKRVIFIKEMDATGLIAVNRWMCEGCWVCEISQSDFDRNVSDNIIETISVSVDRIRRL